MKILQTGKEGDEQRGLICTSVYSYTHYRDSEKYTFSATILPSYYGEEGSHYTGGSYYSWGIGNLSYYTERDKLQWGFSGYLQDASYHDVRIYGSVTKEESGSLQPGQKSYCIISIEYPKSHRGAAARRLPLSTTQRGGPSQGPPR